MRRREFLIASAVLASGTRRASAQQVATKKRVAMVHPSTKVADMRIGGMAGTRSIFRNFNASSQKALQLETGTVPIVFVIGVDPVRQVVVDSLARPGHNVTGCSSFDFSMGGKWAQSLKEIASHTKRMGIIFNPQTAPYMPSIVQSVESGAGPLQIKVTAIPVLDDAELGQAITSLAQQPDGAMVVPPDIFLSTRMKAIVALAAQVRVPAIYPGAPIAKLGGLLAYGPDFSDNVRRAAKLIDRILNGTKPADLPVEQPNKFQMAINLKTAKLLGLTVPLTLISDCALLQREAGWKRRST